MSSSSFDEFCFEFQRSWNLFSFFLKKEFILSLFSVYSFKKSPDFGPSRIILWKNNLGAHRVDFAAFFCAIKNWWEKPCVSHVVKYTIRWESDGKNVLIFRGKNGYQFPRLFQFDVYHCTFSCYGKLMRKPMYFAYYKVYHRM